MNALSSLLALLSSPLGPPLLLTIGAGTMLVLNRPLRRSSQQTSLLTAVALAFVAVAMLLTLRLRADEFVPIFSRPWQPLLQERSNLIWVGDGWNWYISVLILLLGGVGILLDWGGLPLRGVVIASGVQERRRSTTLAVNLGFLAAALLFVGSGNLLTVIITWVVMDLVMLVRRAVRPEPPPLVGGSSPREAFITATLMAIRPVAQVSEYRVRGLSLIGVLLLLIGLLPAGSTGPGQPLLDGTLPYETVYLMLVASVIRAGAYPFHLWLLPDEGERISLAERLLDHIVPVLCGLWLLGWTVDLGSDLPAAAPRTDCGGRGDVAGQRHRRLDGHRPDQPHHFRAGNLRRAGAALRSARLCPGAERADLADNGLCAGRQPVGDWRAGVARMGLAAAH